VVSSTHVAKPPETHDVWPCWQLFEHVSEHDAVGFLPEQTIGDAHAVVELTYGQLFESTAHVASVALSWQSVPLCVHADALHAQDALPAPLVVHAVQRARGETSRDARGLSLGARIRPGALRS